MKKIQDSAAYLFIVFVIVLAAISILGVWEIFGGDVIAKSFQTISLLAVVAVVVIVAGRFVDSRKEMPAGVLPDSGMPLTSVTPVTSVSTNPTFTAIRHLTLVVLIVTVALLALFGVLAIWEVLSGEVVNKSLSSIAIIAFASFVIVLTCLEREDHKLLHQKGKPISGGVIILILLIAWVFLTTLF